MHMDYGEELRFKKEKVDAAIKRIGGIDFETERINGADNTEGYRNKAIYAAAVQNGKAVTGFFRRHTHDVIPAEQCTIQAEYSDRAAKAVRYWMDKCNVSAYDEKTGRGAVRHVFSRYAFGTGQGQVTVVSNEKNLPDMKLLVDTILDMCPETKSIVLNVNKTKGNTVLGGDFVTVWGDMYIEEIICGSVFRLSPRSFCQINIHQAERLYEKAVEYAGLTGQETVIDLYCGTGTITLCLAKKAGRVIGAEIVEAAVADAEFNAERNGVKNAEFICADASEAAKYLKNSGIKPDVLVVDPPRKGLASDVISTIAEMEPDRVVYVSCEPSTLARDLAIFKEKGYTLQKAEAFDLFPRTHHVETVVLLSQQKPDDVIEVDLDLDELDITSAESKATYQEIKDYVLKEFGLKVSTLYISQIKRKCGIEVGEHYNFSQKENQRVPQCPKEKEDAIRAALEHFAMI